MNFYDSALVNRDKHIITKLTELKRKRSLMDGWAAESGANEEG